MGINSIKTLSAIASSLLLFGCGTNLLPGMQNLNTYTMRSTGSQKIKTIKPILTRISPTLIADQKINTYYYHVAPADVLHISVWQHPEFAMEAQSIGSPLASVQGATGQPGYLVNSDGNIYFPLIGSMHVANRTIDEIRTLVTQGLKSYVPNPQVNVRVADFRGQKVYILGEVIKTGYLPLTDQRLSIADALSLSGWFDNKAADPGNIYVIRGDYTHPHIYWLDAKTPDQLLLAERFSLQPHDILYVSSASLTQINRVLEQLLPVVEAVWFTQSLVQNS
jgi:polysaccharide export outer membrane protein